MLGQKSDLPNATDYYRQPQSCQPSQHRCVHCNAETAGHRELRQASAIFNQCSNKGTPTKQPILLSMCEAMVTGCYSWLNLQKHQNPEASRVVSVLNFMKLVRYEAHCVFWDYLRSSEVRSSLTVCHNRKGTNILKFLEVLNHIHHHMSHYSWQATFISRLYCKSSNSLWHKTFMKTKCKFSLHIIAHVSLIGS